MYKELILIVLLASIAMVLVCVPVYENQIRIISNNLNHSLGLSSSVSIGSIDYVRYDSTSCVYVAHIIPQGYYLLSSDDSVFPLLGYSFTSNWNEDDIPIQLRELLESWKQQIRIASNRAAIDTTYSSSWQILLNHRELVRFDDNSRSEPLLQTTWGQGFPYNFYCTMNDNIWVNTPAGCTAVAMAQVMKYWICPDSPENWDGTPPIYRWGDMLPSYNYPPGDHVLNNNDTAVALLMSDIGKSIGINYDPEGSGQWISVIPEALKSHFKYKKAKYVIKNNLSNQWDDRLITELDAGRPLIYEAHWINRVTGYETGAHSFVIDGYNYQLYNNNMSLFYHVNWGWNGSCNGYFRLANLCLPDMFPNTYTNNHRAVINIMPKSYNIEDDWLDWEPEIILGTGPYFLHDDLDMTYEMGVVPGSEEPNPVYFAATMTIPLFVHDQYDNAPHPNLWWQIVIGNFVDPMNPLHFIIPVDTLIMNYDDDYFYQSLYFPTRYQPYFPDQPDESWSRCWYYITRIIIDAQHPYPYWDNDPGHNHYGLLFPDYITGGPPLNYQRSQTQFYDNYIQNVVFSPNEFFYRQNTQGSFESINNEWLSVRLLNLGGLQAPSSTMRVVYSLDGEGDDTMFESASCIAPWGEVLINNFKQYSIGNAQPQNGVINGSITISLIIKWTFIDDDGHPHDYPVYGERNYGNQRTFNIQWTLPTYQHDPPIVTFNGIQFYDSINDALDLPNPHNYTYMLANQINEAAVMVHNWGDVPIINVSFEIEFEKRNFNRESDSDEWIPLEPTDHYHVSYVTDTARINPYETALIDISMIKYRYTWDINHYKRVEAFDPSEWRITCRVYYHWRYAEGKIEKAPYIPEQHMYNDDKVIFLEEEKLTNYGYPRAYVDAMQEDFYNINGGDAIISHTMGEWRPLLNGLPIHLNAGVNFPSDAPSNEKTTFLVSRGYVDLDAAQNSIHAYCEEDNGEFIYQGINDYNIGQDVNLYSIISNSYRNSGVPIGKTMLSNDCELHFEDRSVDGNPINPLRSGGMGNLYGITMVDYKPPIIDNVKIMRQNHQYYNNPIISLDENSNNIIDALEYPQIDIVVNCYDYMTLADSTLNRRKAPYSVSYRLINLDNGSIVKSNTCEFSSVHDKNVIRL